MIEFNENMAKFTFGENVWICRLIDGKYPNYTAVIPKEKPNVLTINRNLLLSSIRRASIFSNKSTNQVRFKLSGNVLHLHAEDTEFANKADIQIPCNYNGEDINIGFSSKFLTEMLSVLGADDITLENVSTKQTRNCRTSRWIRRKRTYFNAFYASNRNVISSFRDTSFVSSRFKNINRVRLWWTF